MQEVAFGVNRRRVFTLDAGMSRTVKEALQARGHANVSYFSSKADPWDGQDSVIHVTGRLRPGVNTSSTLLFITRDSETAALVSEALRMVHLNASLAESVVQRPE